MLNSKSFFFSADCKALEPTIKKVVGVMSNASSPSFFIGVYKKKVCVVGLSGETFVLSAIQGAKASGEGAFGFAPDILSGLIKGRKELEFSFNGQECVFKQVKGPYKGTLVTAPITEDQKSSCEAFLTGSKKVDAVLPAELLACLKSGLAATNIKDVYQGTTLLSYISVDKKGNLSVSSFDSQHFGLLTLSTGVKGLEFKAAMPASHFSLIDQISAGVESKFSFSNGSVRVDGSGFILVLPATQSEDQNYSMVANFVEGLTKPIFKCGYDSGQLSSLTDNLFTLYNANTSFVLSAKDGSSTLSVNFNTPSGSASDAMKVAVSKNSKAFKAGVDPRLFRDILGLSRFIKEPELSINDKVVIMAGDATEGASLFLACARVE